MAWRRTIWTGNAEQEKAWAALLDVILTQQDYPVHLEVIHDEGKPTLEVRMWNDSGLDLSETATPAEHAAEPPNPTVAAVVAAVRRRMPAASSV